MGKSCNVRSGVGFYLLVYRVRVILEVEAGRKKNTGTRYTVAHMFKLQPHVDTRKNIPKRTNM